MKKKFNINLIVNPKVVGDSLESTCKILPNMREVDIGYVKKMFTYDSILPIVGIDTHKCKVVF